MRERDYESKQKIMVMTAGFKNHNNISTKIESGIIRNEVFIFSSWFIGVLADGKKASETWKTWVQQKSANVGL